MTVEFSRLDSIRGETAYIKLIIERTLLIIATSKDLLAAPAPNTFCGQKTQEPFPRRAQIAPVRFSGSSKLTCVAAEQAASAVLVWVE